MSNMDIEVFRAIQESNKVEVLTIGQRTYTSEGIKPVLDPEPTALNLNTLTGFVDYIKINIDNLEINNFLCHIENPGKVSLKSALHGDFQQRAVYACAEFDQPSFPYDKFLGVEDCLTSLCPSMQLLFRAAWRG